MTFREVFFFKQVDLGDPAELIAALYTRLKIAWQDDFDRHAMACWSAIPLNDEYFSFTALQLRLHTAIF